LFLEQDRPAAALAARKAIQLDPNNAQAHMLLGISLPREQQVEAREMMRRARELDPMFALAFANSALVALSSGDANEALEFARQAVAINPEFWVGHFYLGVARRTLGDPQGALQAYADAARFSGGNSLTYSARARLLTRLGRVDDVRALLTDLTVRSARQYVPSYTMAVIHALLGERDAAFQRLERSVQARDLGLPGLASDKAFEALHDDPRFADLLRRCGCAPASTSDQQG
jgi:Flp pilus assembly protein TadD